MLRGRCRMAMPSSAPVAGALSSWQSANHDKTYNCVKGLCSSIHVGTGESILDALENFLADRPVQKELMFVTCFWADSTSRAAVRRILLNTSKRAVEDQRIVRVRICVSSVSLWQKLSHTTSPNGRIYKNSDWPALGLPAPQELQNVDLQVKSVFFRPFSVLHSKFVVIDRDVCILPSCNVSWENWFEGAFDLRGPIVAHFCSYFEQTWGRQDANFSLVTPSSTNAPLLTADKDGDSQVASPARPAFSPLGLTTEQIDMLFLESPHHRIPRFRPFPWQKSPPTPWTPLNAFTLHILESAKSNIFMRTPNLTCQAVVDSLLAALRRGVNVHVITNKRLMTLEQIVTAGTVTPRKVAWMWKQFALLRRAWHQDLERGPTGTLEIEYYDVDSRFEADRQSAAKAHLKALVVDQTVCLVGSGNQDRASWYTSQEVGVALESRAVAAQLARLARGRWHEARGTSRTMLFDTDSNPSLHPLRG